MQLRFLAHTAQVTLQRPRALGDGGDLSAPLCSRRKSTSPPISSVSLLGVGVVERRRLGRARAPGGRRGSRGRERRLLAVWITAGPTAPLQA
jgi:hypothetical protein